MFFLALVFLAIRQAARLEALPYLLHDFACAFLPAATSFDRDIPHAAPLLDPLYLRNWIIRSCSWSIYRTLVPINPLAIRREGPRRTSPSCRGY
jgi:hypothetical protein